MSILKNNGRSFLVLAPVFGIILFVFLYIIATTQYPGGSQVDAHTRGFSWVNNYWCNLLNDNAINGELNPARPIALTGMIVLCFSLAFFWYLFPQHIEFKKYSRILIQFSGMLSMIIALFLFTSFHDTIINVAALLGLIAFVGTFKGLYKTKWYGLLYFGIFNLLLVVVNNYVYYTRGLIIYLPVIQKISFASFLLWISCIDVMLYRKIKSDLII